VTGSAVSASKSCGGCVTRGSVTGWREGKPLPCNKESEAAEMNKGEGAYDVVVIGGGTAGLVTTAGGAGPGGRAAVLEKGKMGGDCLNRGCVPSKALISSARLVEHIRQAEKWGLLPQEPKFQLEAVMARMRERRSKIAPHDSQARFESLGVDVFRGHA